MANLDLAMGDTCSAEAKRQIARDTFARFGQVVVGLLWAPRLSAEMARQHVDLSAMAALLDDLRQQGRGAVLVTAHYNDWELVCQAFGHAGYPVVMVTEPIANARVARLFEACRSASGNRLLPPKYATLKLFRALRAGERVAVMCDVNGRRGRGGVWVNFFGLPVFNGSAMAELSVRTGSPIVMGMAVETHPSRYAVEPTVFEPDPAADHSAEVLRLTQAVTGHLESVVRSNPRPWLWTYKRWKRRPSAERGAYPYYSNFKRVK